VSAAQATAPVRTEAVMGTLVSIRVVRPDDDAPAAIDRAFAWFYRIEEVCSRFNPSSELMQLAAHQGVPVAASDLLFEAVRFAVLVAEETGGAFDPTVGRAMAARGFNRVHLSGAIAVLPPADPFATYRDVLLDEEQRTITLLRPLTLDLGAVAKGMAVDTAARELAPCEDFAIDAGGDLYLGGRNPKGEPWRVGIRHPRATDELVATLRVSNTAVCTSGDYERQHHILDPRTGDSARSVASTTVIAPCAMLADALATGAFVLGPEAGIRLLERQGVEGLIVTPERQQHRTRGFPHVAQDR